MAVPKGKKKSAPGQEKTYTFTFAVPELLGLCAGSVVALCAFFVLGILLGRGYQPEKDVPELAMMMPSQSVNGSGVVKGGLLKPEELDYRDQLKRKPDSAARIDPVKKQVQVVEKKAEPAKQAQRAVAKDEPEAKQIQKTPEPEPAVEIDNPEDVSAPVYNYIYQAASFGSDAKAQEFNSKLRKDGLDAYVQPGKGGTRTWYRVFVRHSGTAESTVDMKKVLIRYGIKKPLLKSKEVVQ